MLIVAIILFLAAAVFGLVLLTAILRNKPTPKPVAIIHGSLAFIAVLLVIIFTVTVHASALLITSIIIFILAALGGFTLIILDISEKPIPKLLAILHPLAAITGLIVLIIGIMQLL